MISGFPFVKNESVGVEVKFGGCLEIRRSIFDRGTRGRLHRAIYRAGMRRKVVRDRERGEAGSLCEAREEKLRDSYSTFLHTHLRRLFSRP